MQGLLKITLISFDHWNYDAKIVEQLNKLGHQAQHINISQYKHKNNFERVKNTFSKIFLGNNPKHFKRQNAILETLISFGKQDYILVLNPDLIDTPYHQEIKKHTKYYITYLYDSITRSKNPIIHLLKDIFDKIYSFDDNDVAKYNFIKTNNYIYLDKQTISKKPLTYKVINISSFDKRFPLINKIANQLGDQKVNFKFVMISKNINYKILKFKKNKNDDNNPQIAINKNIRFQSNLIPLNELINEYENAEIILDLVQGFQDGLSFRVFEALALQKKIITDNESIRNYSFYNPNNILVIDKEKIEIPAAFLDSNYEPIPDEIYNQFTLETWVKTIFNLKN